MIEPNKFVRFFSKDINEFDLKWHWDEEDRILLPLCKTDWYFQEDNEIPKLIDYNSSTEIKKGTYHRLIKGTTDLILIIIKS